MNPLNRINTYWIFQLLGWSAYLFLLSTAVYLKGELTNSRVLLAALSGGLGFGITHLIRFCYLQFHLFEKKLFDLMLRSVMLNTIGAFIFSASYTLLSSWASDSPIPHSFADFFADTVSLFVVLCIWTIIYLSNHFIRKSRLEEIKNLQLQSSQTEIELQHLKTQLNPHFLFNALNSIRALVDMDPVLAKKSITQLSGVLRNSLLFDKRSTITIAEECHFIDDYLSLEKIRFEDRLEVKWEIDETLKSKTIPPLLLQTQVENAVKHGISAQKAGGTIRIRIQPLENSFCLEIRNTGKLAKKTDLGVGLKNARRRLHLVYGDKASFNLFEEDNEVVSQIKIQLV